ncbi:MAG: GNAT family N-acetyltransferase [Planctomycetes bacterium]|nr:GNAT family N-acetyltransferase [Planctomycetota bacterium]
MEIVSEEKGKWLRRTLLVDGEAVSWLNIRKLHVHFGQAVVRVGGIAGVGTAHQHRMKGYSRIVMEDTSSFLQKGGYDVALLFGIEHFYEKFDYAACGFEVRARVRTRDAERVLGADTPFNVRPFTSGDLEAIIPLFNRNNARRTLSVARDPETFRRYPHGSAFKHRPEIFVVEDGRGAFAGYAVTDALPASTIVCEAETGDPEALRAILAELVRTAIERRDGEIVFALPGDHLLVAMLRPLGCVVERTYRTTGGVMGRIISQDAFLGALADAYSAGRASSVESTSLDVEVETDLGVTKVSLPAAEAGTGRLKIPAATLFQVLTGFRDPREVALSDGVEISGDAAAFMELLFPENEPYMFSPDHF